MSNSAYLALRLSSQRASAPTGAKTATANHNTAKTKASEPLQSRATPIAANAGETAKAVQQAVSAERARVTAVFTSQAAKGRERQAANLLASTNRAAGDIAAVLSALPTDAENDRRAAAAEQAAISDLWNNAIARNNA